MRGKFISFEGGEGTGKSTQRKLLQEELAKYNINSIITREPGGSEGAELIRELLVTGDPNRWDSMTEALLLMAGRRDHLRNTILPALDEGIWVICDRFVDSTYAYQGYSGGVELEDLHRIYKMIAGDVLPDLTVLFDLDVLVGLERAASRPGNEDRFERMDIDFHQRMRQAYITMAKAEPNRFVVIDASKSVEDVLQEVVLNVCARFTLNSERAGC